MRIERLEDDRKIRVQITPDDLLDMNINIKMLTPDSPELHSFLFRVMEYVQRETGFNTSDGQVMVEASPQGGGIVLTVTKIAQKKPIIPSKIDLKTVRAKKKEHRPSVYHFANFDAMCQYLAITPSDVFSDMRIYKLEDDYFAITNTKSGRILEFAANADIGSGESFFKEHAKLIAEGETICSLALGIRNLY